jgi:hypothetical protein
MAFVTARHYYSHVQHNGGCKPLSLGFRKRRQVYFFFHYFKNVDRGHLGFVGALTLVLIVVILLSFIDIGSLVALNTMLTSPTICPIHLAPLSNQTLDIYVIAHQVQARSTSPPIRSRLNL